MFIGDSIVQELWMSLVCSINRVLPWTFINVASADPVRIRKDFRFHDRLLGGTAYSSVYNVTIESSLFEFKEDLFALNRSIYSLTAHDILIFNYGLHFHDPILYKQHLQKALLNYSMISGKCVNYRIFCF